MTRVTLERSWRSIHTDHMHTKPSPLRPRTRRRHIAHRHSPVARDFPPSPPRTRWCRRSPTCECASAACEVYSRYCIVPQTRKRTQHVHGVPFNLTSPSATTQQSSEPRSQSTDDSDSPCLPPGPVPPAPPLQPPPDHHAPPLSPHTHAPPLWRAPVGRACRTASPHYFPASHLPL